MAQSKKNFIGIAVLALTIASIAAAPSASARGAQDEILVRSIETWTIAAEAQEADPFGMTLTYDQLEDCGLASNQ